MEKQNKKTVLKISTGHSLFPIEIIGTGKQEKLRKKSPNRDAQVDYHEGTAHTEPWKGHTALSFNDESSILPSNNNE